MRPSRRPQPLGLTHLSKRLATNTGLINLDLTGHRISSKVAIAFVEMFRVNMTLCKLLLMLEVGGYTLRFTELTNRNKEIDRLVREDKNYTELLPRELRVSPPHLEPRIVPDPDNEDLGLEFSEAATVWCQVERKWSLGTIVGTRKRKAVVSVDGMEHDFEPKDLTEFEPSHARDLPNMVMMQNLHEAPLLYLLRRRLKDGRIYTWAGDVLLALNPYQRIPELYEIANFLDTPKPPEVVIDALVSSRASLTHSFVANSVGTPRRRSSLAPWGASSSAATVAAAAKDAPTKEASASAATADTPHAYTVAKHAYTALVTAMGRSAQEVQRDLDEYGLHVDQSVLISGESGAGKTEASKHVLEYLTAASRHAKAGQSHSGAPLAELDRNAHNAGLRACAPVAEGAKASPVPPHGLARLSLSRRASASGAGRDLDIEVLLRDASPILESLGNAKTVRNDNSSRFGKYVAVQYAANGGIVGAATETYLLERSRVVDIAPGERNYHIFYQLLTHVETTSTWRLPPVASNLYLGAEGQIATIEGCNDSKDFLAVQRAFETFGFSGEEQRGVLRILAAILLLGNVRFAPQQGSGGDGGGQEIADVVDEAKLSAAAAALGCDRDALRFPLTKKNLTVMGITIVQNFTARGADQARDALSKVIFAALFDLIVSRINAISNSQRPDVRTIGILDIFGFESLKTKLV